MALIICPECGHQVSDKAEACPGCGVKVTYILNMTEARTSDAIVEEKSQPAMKQPRATSQPPAQKEKKGGKSAALLVVSFLIALILCAVGYYFYNEAQQQKEQEDYVNAMCSTDPLVMQMYLTRYADAPQEHRDSVNARMFMLSQQDNEWNNAVMSGSRGELEKYIQNNPNSPHKGEALNKIDSIDFAVASRKNSLEAYEDYLTLHPEGKNAGQAQDFVESKKATMVLPEELALARQTCKLFFQAINSHSESKLLGVVTDVLQTFLNRSDALSSDVVGFMNRLYKEDITNMNWHILDDFKAEKVKVGDNTYNIKVQFPAEQKIERTDDTKEKYGKYIISAEVTPEGKITKFGMKKVTEQNQ